MTRVLVLNPTEITRDPRARRQLVAATRAGYDTVGLCGQLSGLAPLPLELPVHRVGRERLAPAVRQLGIRRGSGGRLERELRGVFRLGRLVRLTAQLVRRARHLGPFDLVHANELETLAAAVAIARRSRARLVYDAHELYASSEPDYPSVYAGVTRRLEAAFARRADAVTTVSAPIAEELQRRLRLRRRPATILNCPEAVDGLEPQPVDGPLRVVYQGATGASRPLVDVLDAIAAAPSVHVTIRVVGADRGELRAEATRRGVDGRIDVAEPVPPTSLVSALAGEEIGLVINRPLTRNDELVFPNKLFEYLMAGAAVVVPRLPGLARFVEQEHVGAVFEPGRPESLADVLESLARDRNGLLELRRRARAIAVERFNAEAQAAELRAVWREALS